MGGMVDASSSAAKNSHHKDNDRRVSKPFIIRPLQRFWIQVRSYEDRSCTASSVLYRNQRCIVAEVAALIEKASSFTPRRDSAVK